MNRQIYNLNSCLFDDYKSESYVILVNYIKQFNCLMRNPDIEHVMCIKKESKERLESFLKYCRDQKKTVIYIKKDRQADLLDTLDFDDYVILEYMGNDLCRELETGFKSTIFHAIKLAKRRQARRRARLAVRLREEEEEDEELDRTLLMI